MSPPLVAGDKKLNKLSTYKNTMNVSRTFMVRVSKRSDKFKRYLDYLQNSLSSSFPIMSLHFDL